MNRLIQVNIFLAALFTNMFHIMLLSLLYHPDCVNDGTDLTGTSAERKCDRESDLFIMTPGKMEALSGSCLYLPCKFKSESNSSFTKQPTCGMWLEKTTEIENLIFSSCQKTNKYPMEIIGLLENMNCGTQFSSLNKTYSNTYFFRIDSKNPTYKATAVCDPVHITVNDTPPNPNVEISGEQTEGVSVNVSCSAPSPCPRYPPQLSWNLLRKARNIKEQNTDGTSKTKIQMPIKLSAKWDGHIIGCSAKYPVNNEKDFKTSQTTITLNVSYAPKGTSVTVSPSNVLPAGSLVTLNCSSRAKPPITSLTWFRKTKDGAINVSVGESYSFNVTESEVYYCLATNMLGGQNSTRVYISIADPRSTLWFAVIGVLTGIIILVCFCVCVYFLMLKHSSSQHAQNRADQNGAADKNPEEIHYGELDLSKMKSTASSARTTTSHQQQDTVYSEVKLSKPPDTLTQRADGTEELYANIEKK